MNITAKVYGRSLEDQVYKLRKDGVKIFNDEIRVSLKENSSVLDLMKVLEIYGKLQTMCLINGKIPHLNNKLGDGDKVEIVLLVDGG
jgi:hypothetical protein